MITLFTHAYYKIKSRPLLPTALTYINACPLHKMFGVSEGHICPTLRSSWHGLLWRKQFFCVMKEEKTGICISVPLMPCLVFVLVLFWVSSFFRCVCSAVMGRGNMNNMIPLGLTLPGTLPALWAGTAARAEDWSCSFLVFEAPSYRKKNAESLPCFAWADKISLCGWRSFKFSINKSQEKKKKISTTTLLMAKLIVTCKWRIVL